MSKNDLILNYHDAVIYQSDLAILKSPTAWLNDACIHFFLTKLQREDGIDPKDTFLDPSVLSFFMNQCSDEEDIEDTKPLDRKAEEQEVKPSEIKEHLAKLDQLMDASNNQQKSSPQTRRSMKMT